MTKRLLGMFVAIMLIALMFVPAVAATKPMYVQTNTGVGLNVRSTPKSATTTSWAT